MALGRFFQLSSLLRSAVAGTLRRNIGISAVVFNRAKDMDPIQKLFLDKIRDYNTKSKSSGGVVDAGPSYQKNLNEELGKLQRLFGGGELTKFPEFKFPGQLFVFCRSLNLICALKFDSRLKYVIVMFFVLPCLTVNSGNQVQALTLFCVSLAEPKLDESAK
uniref:ATP synthase peripheral stalk subunit F6, mitochondrial n=1 Tax=Denticeps clupeoides TaxID=299321 RepID=A0AAY4CK15_9TELE